LPSGAKVEFVCSDLFAYEPEEPFDVVNSLGVLHHTPDCRAAIQKALTWIAPGGYLHLGLYHRYGRQPFLDHFARLKNGHASFGRLFEEFERLNPDISDQTHLLSWFRDQVLHPHETQHTYEELHQLLTAEGFTIESTSINNFGKLAPLADMIEAEKECALASEKALRQGRYYPGFFVVWARKLNGAPIAAKSQKDSRSHARSETGIAG
jgi:SAM-dependent methyltransferase